MPTIPNDRGIVSVNVSSIQILNSSSYFIDTSLVSFSQSSSNSISALSSSSLKVDGSKTIETMGTFIASANTPQRLATLTGSGGGSSTPIQYWTI